MKCILFLAGQNLALHDHSDDELLCNTNLHQENFKNLIAFRAETGNIILAKHLETCAWNASYLSPRIQNEPIVLSANVVRNKLLRELIHKQLFYFIMADETTDICSDQQLSISIRFVSSESDENGKFIREVFWSFIFLKNLTVVGVAGKIWDFLKNTGLSIDLLN